MTKIEKQSKIDKAFRAAYTCVKGLRHERRGLPCQDAASFIKCGSTAALALCDGAGTAKFAKEGASACAETAAHFAAEYFDMLYNTEDRLREEKILPAVRGAMFARAAELGCDIAELSCTLLLAAAAQDGRSFFLHIGDGVVLGLSAEGAVLLSRYEHRYENATSFVTSPLTCGVSRHFPAPGMCAFLLATDGVSEQMLLAPGGSVRAAAGTLLAMSCIVPQAAMEEEYRTAAGILQKRRLSADDISLASLANTAGAGEAVWHISAENRRLLFAEPANRRNRAVKRKFAGIIRRLSQGVVYPAQIFRGKKTRGRRYLSAFCRAGIVQRAANGGYTIPI